MTANLVVTRVIKGHYDPVGRLNLIFYSLKQQGGTVDTTMTRKL